MARGRPPRGAALVDGLEGSRGAKERLKLSLETLGGKKSVVEAAAKLGMGETAFYRFRSEWLQEALFLLEPKARGRPRKAEEPVNAEEVARLRSQNEALSRALLVASVREEIAVVMPRVLERAGEKKTRWPPERKPGGGRGLGRRARRPSSA